MSFAQNNEATVSQTGNNDEVNISQIGNANVLNADARHNSSVDYAEMSQNGSHNFMSLHNKVRDPVKHFFHKKVITMWLEGAVNWQLNKDYQVIIM